MNKKSFLLSTLIAGQAFWVHAEQLAHRKIEKLKGIAYLVEASHFAKGEKLAVLSDGQTGNSSYDKTVKRLTFWPHKGTQEHFTLRFKKATKLDTLAAYWFHDTGSGDCALPKAWRVLYKSADGWKPVKLLEESKVVEDRFNVLKFEAVNTSVVRVEFDLAENKSAGLLELKAAFQGDRKTVQLSRDEVLKRLKSEAKSVLFQDLKEFNGYSKRPKTDGPIGKDNVAEFLGDKIPTFLSSNEDFTETYNYRWWAISKHLRKWKGVWVFTEFFGWPGHGSRSGAIPCPAGHQFYDLRWMRDPQYLQSYVDFYMSGFASKNNQREGFPFHGRSSRPESHHYSSWMIDGVEAFLKVHPNENWRDEVLPHMEKHQQVWDDKFTVQKPGAKTDGMYRILDLYDGNEFTISASIPLIKSAGAFEVYKEDTWKKHYLGWGAINRMRKSQIVKDHPEAFRNAYPQMHLVRPSFTAYMFANVRSLGELYSQKAAKTGLAEDKKKAEHYTQKSNAIQKQTLALLWDEEDQFFYAYTAADNPAGVLDWKVKVRESVGYTPWYFNMLPKGEGKYSVAWDQFGQRDGFMGDRGMTTAERRSPYYNEKVYAWNGRGWPFQNSIAYKSFANYLRNYKGNESAADRDLLYKHIAQYVKMHGKKRNIGEYYLPTTSSSFGGVKDYFHSTFPDMIIEDLLGFQSSHKDHFSLKPLLPEEEWDFFYLGDILYRGREIDIVWKKDWDAEKAGDQSELCIWVDGELKARSEGLNKQLNVKL